MHQALGSGDGVAPAPTGVTSITGTANQITASAPTGDVTLSIPNSPIFTTPNIGAATGTSINLSGGGIFGGTVQINPTTTEGFTITRRGNPGVVVLSIQSDATNDLRFNSTGDLGYYDVSLGSPGTLRHTLALNGNATHTGDLTVSGTGLQTIGGAASTVRMPGYGAGAATFDSSGNITSVSDERMKDIDGPFTKGLAELRKLTPQVFHWNEASGLNRDDVNVSLIAQELIAAGVPEAVFTERTVDVMEEVVEKHKRTEQVKDDTTGQVKQVETLVDVPVTRVKRDARGAVVTQRVPSTYTVSDRAVIALLLNAIKDLDARLTAAGIK